MEIHYVGKVYLHLAPLHTALILRPFVLRLSALLPLANLRFFLIYTPL
jgi:hypothetical protein